MTAPHEIVLLHCNSCLGQRNHKVLFSEYRNTEEVIQEHFIFEEKSLYRVAECEGCDSISFHVKWSSSSNPDPIDEQWPPKINRREPKWMLDLLLSEAPESPVKQEFLREIYAALKNGSNRLAVMGVRALLEHVMIEQIGDHGRFSENVNQFQSAGFISRIQREALDPIIEAGHASMHRGYRASPQEIEAILDVTENILESIYVARVRATKLEVPAKELRQKRQ